MIDLLRELVRIDSVNPALDPAGAGETRLAQFVRDWCQARGLGVRWVEPLPGRPSLVVRAPGTGDGRSLMLYAHLDTVGTAGMTDPFAARREAGFLYGRGACDMKAGLAAALKVMEQVATQPLAGDVWLVAVSDEEHGSLGIESVLPQVQADAALLTEPTGMELCLAHRGFAVFELEIVGRASHTSQPQLGVNAVRALGHVLGAIERLDAQLREREPHPLLGYGSAQAVRVSSDGELFVTPASARLTYERRTLPGETPEQLLREVESLLGAARTSSAGVTTAFRTLVAREPFEASPDSALARCLAQAAEAQFGQPPTVSGAPYWMDSALIAARGIPAVVFGPTPHGIHATDERVDEAEVRALEAVLKSCVQAFCGGGSGAG